MKSLQWCKNKKRWTIVRRQGFIEMIQDSVGYPLPAQRMRHLRFTGWFTGNQEAGQIISFFNGSFHLYHDIRGDGVHFMDSFCVFGNPGHQLCFGGSRSLKPAVLGYTDKGRHGLHQCLIIFCLFIFFYIFSS